jgi:hypothetical protein
MKVLSEIQLAEINVRGRKPEILNQKLDPEVIDANPA